MKRIVASMLAVAIAVCFSFSTGCTPKDEPKNPPSGEITKKDKEYLFTVTKGKIKEVKFAAETKDFELGTPDKEKGTFSVKALKEPGDTELKAEITIILESGGPLKTTIVMPVKGKTPTTPTAATSPATSPTTGKTTATTAPTTPTPTPTDK